MPAIPGGAGGGGAGGGHPGFNPAGGNFTPAVSGTVNTGGGGGGSASGNGDGGPGGAGGSGIVIVRGPSAVTFAVAPCTNATATTPGGCKTAKFTVTGTLTVS